jgi:hypothetical protein
MSVSMNEESAPPNYEWQIRSHQHETYGERRSEKLCLSKPIAFMRSMA